MDMGFPSRLRRIIEESGLNINTFAQKCGISTSSLQRYLRGTNEPKLSFLIKLITIFDLNPIWLLTGRGNPHQKCNISVIPTEPDLLTEGKEFFLVPLVKIRVVSDLQELTPKKILNWIAMDGEWFNQWGGTTVEKIKKFIFIRADGHAMSPTIVEGDIVLINRNREERIKIVNDAIYLIRDKDGSVSLKRLASFDGRRIFCISDNHLEYNLYELNIPESASLEDYVLGRAVWICKKMS